MTVLGIETSCDETAAAISRDGVILASVVSSQGIHSRYGGVVPEVASREHERFLTRVVQASLNRSGITLEDLDGIAATRGPGLMGALLTGVSFAQGLARGTGVICLGIDHIEAHIFANFIAYPDLEFPFLCLLVSGGHTQIWRVDGLGRYDLLGETRDDAAGEAFDKGARILGLGFPGGPVIERAARGGNEDAVDFPQAFLTSNAIEFSFSGLKTSLLNYVKKLESPPKGDSLSDVAASYQKAIVSVLVSKLKQAVERTGIQVAVIAGGVAANEQLRILARNVLTDCAVLYPPAPLCTDNGAMVAFLGERYLEESPGEMPLDLTVVPNLRLSG
ncbi:MAG: tRNA (adenosine(37)-N6)-threonylcarbamoyltransferase complex transferase subunit TsaD [Fidelibacterota bacterium]